MSSPEKATAPQAGGAGADSTTNQTGDSNPEVDSEATPMLDGMVSGKATGWPREPGTTHYFSRDSDAA
jgi:hypothetical protein